MSSPRSIASKFLFDSPSCPSSPALPSSRIVDLHFLHHEDISLNLDNDIDSHITANEFNKIMKHRVVNDQKLGLGSILLQHYSICDKFGCDKSQYEIARTSFGKPFILSKHFQIDSWNYNVSHHGNYVGIVTSNHGNIGLDIATLTPRKTWEKDSIEYINLFLTQFTSTELKWQLSGLTEKERYRRFFINWSLKEAYIKAVGQGLQMDLLDIEFTIQINELDELSFEGNAMLTIYRNNEMTSEGNNWIFQFKSLDDNHVAAVALGPPPSSPSSSPSSSASSSLSSLPPLSQPHHHNKQHHHPQISSIILNPIKITTSSLISSPNYF